MELKVWIWDLVCQKEGPFWKKDAKAKYLYLEPNTDTLNGMQALGALTKDLGSIVHHENPLKFYKDFVYGPIQWRWRERATYC